MGLLLLVTILVAVIAALPAVGGHLLVITSGSMRPGLQPGDAVVITETTPEAVERGDVITFQGYGRDGLTTHRVVGFHDVEGRRHFLTQGDANEERDRDAAPPESLAGTVRLRLPGAGWLLQLLGSPHGRLLTLALPAGIIAGLELRDVLRGLGIAQRLARLDRHARVRPGAITLAAGGVLVVAGAQLALAGVGQTGALLTHTDTVADSTVATADVVPPATVTATFDCGTLGLGKGILVEWDAVTGADGYEVARSTDTGGPYDLLASVDASTTSYLDDTVDNSTTYYYVVRTVDGDWTSEHSAEASETTPSSTECLL